MADRFARRADRCRRARTGGEGAWLELLTDRKLRVLGVRLEYVNLGRGASVATPEENHLKSQISALRRQPTTYLAYE